MGLQNNLSQRYIRRAVCVCTFVIGTMLSVFLPTTQAGPEGAQVVHGDVSFNQSGNTTSITASDKSIINYRSFDIAKPEIVEFIQPSSQASVLNRINSATPTNIDGTLRANGRVFFVNPAGVYIGEGAKINVNQLVASGLNISDADFMSGRMNFADGDGTVTNRGDILAEKVYLVGKHVVNSGNIICPGGYVVMAAGERVFLREQDSNILVEFDPPTSPESAVLQEPAPGVLNEGTVTATGGNIILAAGDIYSQAVSNVGSLSVSVEVGDGGQIRVTGSGQFSNTGTIEATSQEAKGGTVAVSAAEVINSGSVDVTGREGGNITMEATGRLGQFGTIHADGTSANGGDVSVQAGDVVAMSAESLTTANAGTNGDGGKVTVYSPDTALFWPDAKIEASGGAESGDGGLIEVSGGSNVEINGEVDASASNGAAGTFKIDPTDITVVDTDDPEKPSLNDPRGDTWVFVPTDDENEITDDFIEGLLSSGTSVMLDTTNGFDGPGGGDIVVAAPIDFSDFRGDDMMPVEAPDTYLSAEGDGVTLTLVAADDIEIRPHTGIDSSSLGYKLNVVLQANRSGGGNDPDPTFGDVKVYAPVSTNGGSFTSSGVNFNSRDGPIDTAGGDVDINHMGDVDINAAVTTTGGGFSSSAVSFNNRDGPIDTAGGDVDINHTGEVDIKATITTTGGRFSSSGVNFDNTNGPIDTADGDVKIEHTGNVTANIISGGEILIITDDNLTVAGGKITATEKIELHSGVDGTGNLSFEPGAKLACKEIELRAGDGLDFDYSVLDELEVERACLIPADDGLGGGGKDGTVYFANLEVIGNKSFTIRQDAPITKAPARTQFETDGVAVIALHLQSDDGFITSTTAHEWRSISASAREDITLQGSGKITTGTLKTRKGNISIRSTGGDLIINGEINAFWRGGEVPEDDDDCPSGYFDPGHVFFAKNLPGGGVELLADRGGIYSGEYGPLNVNITAFWDENPNGIGVVLPGEEGRAAIVISSQEDLHLGDLASMELRVGKGTDATDAANYAGVDDRQAVDFLAGPPGYERVGDPIDVSIYLRSTRGNVKVESEAKMNRHGAMVMDAWDKVEFGGKFVESWGEGLIARLEVVSRRTQTLGQAVRYGTLRGASELREGEIPMWIVEEAEHIDKKLPDENTLTSEYVLRGGSLGQVLASIEVSAPKVAENRWETLLPWTAVLPIFLDPTLQELVQEDKEEQKKREPLQDEDSTGRLPVNIHDADGNPKKPKIGLPLEPGYIVETREHGIASITFRNGTIILEPNTKVAIDNPSLLLIRGRFFSWVREKISELVGKGFGVRTISQVPRRITPGKSLTYIGEDGVPRNESVIYMGDLENVFWQANKVVPLQVKYNEDAIAWLSYFGPADQEGSSSTADTALGQGKREVVFCSIPGNPHGSSVLQGVNSISENLASSRLR